MRDWQKCTLHKVERKGTSYYGNPSYWIYFSDSEGNFHAGYTAINSSAGYTASNYKYCDEGQVIFLDYHFTKKKEKRKNLCAPKTSIVFGMGKCYNALR